MCLSTPNTVTKEWTLFYTTLFTLKSTGIHNFQDFVIPPVAIALAASASILPAL